jgi:hypothetical protein
VLGAIAVGCIVTILVLGNLINGLFTDPAPFPAEQQHPFTPAAARSSAVLPTSIADCIDGRWRNYVGFTSQADCEAYVAGNPP